MDNQTKDRLKNLPKTVCAKCGSKRSYSNPMARCFECKKKFCFSHIWGGQVKKGMDLNDELRNVCEDCIKSHEYRRI